MSLLPMPVNRTPRLLPDAWHRWIQDRTKFLVDFFGEIGHTIAIMNANWILKNGAQRTECASFPFAFRTAFNLIRKAIEAKQDASAIMRNLSIVGPPGPRGERTTYSYASAKEMAEGMGLLSPEGQINSREFKRR